ncbi:MBL fold metallo-hydrolase [Ruegeria sp. HKCCA4812]|uniref:MBL fold metallo-hydrolase n=1 Tax=Ruegeria sp. HKCCA4812 TaxID=2682993 RepID=UPI0014880B77|nr:hypothetical protein [Ruegeria sp. HKCCA4812]
MRQRIDLRLTISAGIVALVLLSACADQFKDRVRDSTLSTAAKEGPVLVTYSGISTLLIQDNKTQIVIDGYYSREEHMIVRKIEPDMPEIERAAKQLGLNRFFCAGQPSQNVVDCPAAAHRGLSYVIPMHAHYDHAMDSPIVAAMHRARLIADPSVKQLTKAAIQMLGEDNTQFDWSIKPEKPPAGELDPPKVFRTGDFEVALIRTPHFDSFVQHFLNRKQTRDNFTFPARIHEMGEGHGVSVQIHHRSSGWSMLIIGSAGDVGARLAAAGPRAKADVVFFGIGGLGLKPKTHRKSLTETIVEVTGARRIIPTHWDAHGQKLFNKLPPADNLALKPFPFDPLDATLRTLDELQTTTQPDIRFAPLLKPFDPFQDLSEPAH